MKTLLLFFIFFAQLNFQNENAEASFPGGASKMYKFIWENFIYPEAALKAGVSGKIYLSFAVKKDGTLEEIKVERGVGFGLDAEVKRVIGLMPNWIPATKDGKKIDSIYKLPIACIKPD
jgi:periplasmic protein TonB